MTFVLPPGAFLGLVMGLVNISAMVIKDLNSEAILSYILLK